jgi:hypothetical protein
MGVLEMAKPATQEWIERVDDFPDRVSLLRPWSGPGFYSSGPSERSFRFLMVRRNTTASSA